MPTTVLQTEHLTKRYGALTAVDDLSLEIHEGEIFGFLGPNGAGKTTSINMMCGLLKPDAGRVLIHGKPIHGGASEVRARVGVCPQETVLWEKLTALEQLEFIGSLYGVPPRIARQRGGALLEVLGLSAKSNELAGKLSGGMKRRLNLALALVHDPEILVLDEPEAGLDPQSRVLVREYIRSLARRKTVILTTHNMDEAERLADRVAIIDHGRLLVVDTPEELKRTVGEGDVLEVNIGEASPDSSSPTPASTIAARFFADISTVNHTLTVRGRGLIERLPELLQALREAGVKTSDVRLRVNSLEDVFLSLTGRRLRE
ncbi:MAG: ABC transporter ATP-binding protein [Anaerolineales bacterium]|nr:ABC transporter ATP-binding protein [Anaerolineales bacterium]